MSQIKSGEQVDWNNWKNKEIASLCEEYIDMRWCRRHKKPLIQYEEFLYKVNSAERKIKEILKKFIHGIPGLKMFLCVHSVFDQSTKRRWDWLVKLMSEEIMPTDEEIKKFYEAPEIPEEVLKLFAKFNPRPVSNAEYHPNRIEYKLWGDPREGESTDPINIIYTQWEEDSKRLSEIQVKSFISKYGNIDVPQISKS